MKTGISLTALAQKIEANAAQKRDFVSDTRELNLSEDGTTLAINGHVEVKVNANCHRQIAERLDIPAKYYQRMQDSEPKLLATNVNTWFHDKPERRMVRTLADTGRAFLSDRYNRIEHEEIASVSLPVLGDFADLHIESCELTETRMYIKAVTPRIAGEVKVGDEVQAGIIISNSEIGMGAVNISPFVYRLICKNGMVVNDGRLRASHIGARADASESVYEMLTDETLEADDRAILLKVRDVVRATLTQEVFNRHLLKFQEATTQLIEGNPVKAVEVLGKRVGLLEGEKGSILRHLITGGDLSKWGLANAVTRFAHEPADYDRATQLEAIGGRIIDLPSNDWKAISKAA